MSLNIEVPAKVNRERGYDARYARAMRELRAPLECNDGKRCWKAQGGVALLNNSNSGAPRCRGCGGRIRSEIHSFTLQARRQDQGEQR